ncbi:serine-rich adhesin for platelets-like [Haliotis rufescens]|uniref:serine-rich adhesin for platelets-like n=1 Tax=Haliotis rufescens TaxID=6454 RepID=UPI00201F6C9D|nr:serine-rich adhesin for platelets-like [Haliotis rufescens]
MWLSKSKTSSKDDTSSKQTTQGIGSQQHDLFNTRKRRRWEVSDENLDNRRSVSEKPSTAKKTKAAASTSQYEDEVSDEEFVIIDLFSSDEHETSSQMPKSDVKTVSHISSSQKKKTPNDTRSTASNSQVSPIYNTSSIFKKFQNQSGGLGASSSKQGVDDEMMFTQDAGDTDLPELSWPKRRTVRLSQRHSSTSSQSQASQSPKRNKSMSQIVSRVISDINSSSSDAEETLAEKLLTLKRHAKQQPADSKSNKAKSCGQVMKSPGDTLTALKPRPNKLSLNKKNQNVSSDSFSDFVILETSNGDSSSDDIPTSKENIKNEQKFVAIAKRGKVSTTCAPYHGVYEKDNKCDSQICKGERHKDIGNVTKSNSTSVWQSSAMTKSSKKNASSSASDSEFPKKPPLSSANLDADRKKGQAPYKSRTSTITSSRKAKIKRDYESFSDDDISCHSAASSDSEGEYHCQPLPQKAPRKSKAIVSSSDEETQEYQYEQGEHQTRTPALSSLIVSQTAKEKLKKVVSATCKMECRRGSTQDGDATQQYDFKVYDNRHLESMSFQTAADIKQTKETKSAQGEETVPGSKTKDDEIDDELTQPPDTLFDSQEGDDSDIMVIGLDEDVTQPMEEDDEELTQEPSQTVYGNPPELSLVDAMLHQKCPSNISDVDPPLLSQQVLNPKVISCVKPPMVETAITGRSFTESKKIESKSGGSTDSNASENCLLFKPVCDRNREGEEINENSGVFDHSKHSEISVSGFHKKYVAASKQDRAEDTRKEFTDIPDDFESIKVKKEGVKIKQEKLELPTKLPCYTQEEDVIFVYDSSDDEALIDLSQTNVRSEHISDTDSMFDVFDHSDTELFDLDFGEEDVTLVNDSDQDKSLEEIAEEDRNPFDHLGESDESDQEQIQGTTTTKKKGTFDFESVSDNSKHANCQMSSKPGKRRSIWVISSDSDEEEIFHPEHGSPHSMSVSKVLETNQVEDIYLAETQVDDVEDNGEMLEAWDEKPPGLHIVPNYKQYPLTSDNSVFNVLTEVDDSLDDKSKDNCVIKSKSDLGDNNQCHKESEIQTGSSVAIQLSRKVSRGKSVSFNLQQESSTDDSFLSDEDIYMAATQMDASVSEALQNKANNLSKDKAIVSSDNTQVVVARKTELCQDQHVCSQEKKMRKTASVKSVVWSSPNVEMRPPVFKPPKLSMGRKSTISHENIFDVDTQIDCAHLPSEVPSKTSTPKATDVKSKVSLFGMTKLNLQKLYSAQTQSMSPSIHADSTTAQKAGVDPDTESDDDALYRALDDLEETNLSCLNSTGLAEKVLHKDLEEDVYGAATQVQPEPRGRSSQQRDVFGAATQVDPASMQDMESLQRSSDEEVPPCMDVDPFDVMTQVDEPCLTKSLQVESCGMGVLPERRRESAETNLPKIAQSVMKKIMTKHVQRKSIMVLPPNSKVSETQVSNKQEEEQMKTKVAPITKSNFYKATPPVKTTWLSKRVPPQKTVPQKTGRMIKKKKQKSEDIGFSLTQKIQTAKRHQKERSHKTAVDPLVPSAKMEPAALHTSSSDVALPDEEEIMAKGLPLLTFNKLVEKHKPDRAGNKTSSTGKHADEHLSVVDMEVENITSSVIKTNTETLLSSVLNKDISRVCGKSKDRSKSTSPKPSSSKTSHSSSKHSSRSSHPSHSSHSKSVSSSSKVTSSSSKSSSSKTTPGSSKSTSSSSKSTSRSAHSGSSSTSSTSGSSKPSSRLSPGLSKPLGSSSVSKQLSTPSSKSSGSVRPSPLSQNSRHSVADRKDLVPPKSVEKKSCLDVSAGETDASTPPPERTSSPTASAQPAKEASFDLSMYPLPAKARTTPTPLAGPGKENKGQSIVAGVPETASTLKTTAFHAPERLSTPSPAHLPNDLKLSENDPRKASLVRSMGKSVQQRVSRETSALASGQHRNLLMKHPHNLLVKPTVSVIPMGINANQRPRTTFRPIEPILPFSQMLKGSAGEHRPTVTATTGAKVQGVIKDPAKLMDMTYYLQRVLAWNPLWLEEQCKPEFAGHPPPILKPEECVYPLLESYTSLEDYQTIMTRLLLMETWDMIFKEWKQKKVKTVTNVMFLSVDICSKQDKGGLSKFIWQGVLTREQYRRGQYPMEGDLLGMNVWGSPLPAQKDAATRAPAQPTWKPFMGYVERMNVRPCDNAYNLFRTYPLLKSCVEKLSGELHLLTLTALGRYRKFKPISDRLMTLEPLCSLVSSRRQFQGLTYLPRSPLLRDILHPSSQRVFHQDIHKPDPTLLKCYNQSQAEAISAVCRAVQEPRHMPRICLLQGPPGTGKTHTITGIITKIIQDSKGQCCVCLCTPSNGAADELMRRLVALRSGGGQCASMRLVRFGKVNSIHSDVQEYSYDELVNTERAKEEKRKRDNNSSLPDSVRQEQHQLRKRIEKIQKELDDISRSGNKIQIDRRQADLRKFEKELKYLDNQQSGPAHHSVQLTHSEETRIRQRVLQDAHVICGTLSSLGSARIMNILRTNNRRNPFLCAIIDEATQSTELDCLIPLQYGVSKLVMVGDPEQLPPTVISQKAKDMKFGLSLFERLYSYFKSKDQNVVLMLKTQYRMDPAILSFPNLYVYDGQLNTDSLVGIRGKNWPLLPYLVFNIEDGQEQSSTEGSVSNQAEANCVAELCQLIMTRSKIPATRIGVICPYQSQRCLVNNSLSYKRVRDVEVGTVDGFQGREKHVIIMSCVRARRAAGSIGFLSDRRRMNVALTRAKYALYILGHLDTLKRGQDWRSLIDDAKRRDVVVNVPTVNNFSTMATKCFKPQKAGL